jgi:hypothetical protein
VVNHCANPLCGKPLHYLREGRVYLFTHRLPGAGDDANPRALHLEHYWLCGVCSLSMILVQDAETIRLLPRRQLVFTHADSKDPVPWEAE